MGLVYAQIPAEGDRPIINSGGIASIQALGDGKYRVEFQKGTFTQPPAVAATVISAKRECGRSGTSRFISITELHPNQVCFAIISAGGKSVARDFNFVATGP